MTYRKIKFRQEITYAGFKDREASRRRRRIRREGNRERERRKAWKSGGEWALFLWIELTQTFTLPCSSSSSIQL